MREDEDIDDDGAGKKSYGLVGSLVSGEN